MPTTLKLGPPHPWDFQTFLRPWTEGYGGETTFLDRKLRITHNSKKLLTLRYLKNDVGLLN